MLTPAHCVADDCGAEIDQEDSATCSQCGEAVCWLCLDDHQQECWDMFYGETDYREDPFVGPPEEPMSDP